MQGNLVGLAEWETKNLALMRAWGSFAKGEQARQESDSPTALLAYRAAFWSVSKPGGIPESVFCAMQTMAEFDQTLGMFAMEAEAVLQGREDKAMMAELAASSESRQRAAAKCHDCGEHVFAGYHQCRVADRVAYGAVIWSGIKREVAELLRDCGKCVACLEAVDSTGKIFICRATMAHAVCGR